MRYTSNMLTLYCGDLVYYKLACNWASRVCKSSMHMYLNHV